jgi:uncharacterized protein YdaU (DUF1376 family)
MSKKATKKSEEKEKNVNPKEVKTKNTNGEKSGNLKEKQLPNDFDFDLDDIEIIESKVFA